MADDRARRATGTSSIEFGGASERVCMMDANTLAYVLSPLFTGEHLRIFNLR
jgi:hypothetical protein